MNDREAIKGLQNIVEYWTLNPHEQEVAKHAISAMQERVERGKGCTWCTREREVDYVGKRYFRRIYSHSDDGSGEACLAYHKEYGWTLHWEDEDSGLMFDMVIDNCPMCGRKLKEEPHAD